MLCAVTKFFKHLLIEHWHYKKISSTQSYAKQIELLPNAWRLISASKQTAGYGQMKRPWISDQCGNIYATLIIPLEKKYINSSRMLPQITAFSIIQVLQSKGFMPKLKWINDIFINHKKVGGVLCEQYNVPKLNLQKLLVGFGINVNSSKKMFASIDQAATSLFIENGKKINSMLLLYEIVEMIYNNFQLFYLYGFKYFLNQIINLLEYKDSFIYLDLNKKLTTEHANGLNTTEDTNIIYGKLVGLNEDGSLILSTLDGNIRQFNYGRIKLKTHANN